LAYPAHVGLYGATALTVLGLSLQLAMGPGDFDSL